MRNHSKNMLTVFKSWSSTRGFSLKKAAFAIMFAREVNDCHDDSALIALADEYSDNFIIHKRLRVFREVKGEGNGPGNSCRCPSSIYKTIIHYSRESECGVALASICGMHFEDPVISPISS